MKTRTKVIIFVGLASAAVFNAYENNDTDSGWSKRGEALLNSQIVQGEKDGWWSSTQSSCVRDYFLERYDTVEVYEEITDLEFSRAMDGVTQNCGLDPNWVYYRK